jgi:hypothetical protein
MANPEHIEKLLEVGGLERWNRWREQNREIDPDLTGAKLSYRTSVCILRQRTHGKRGGQGIVRPLNQN